jgi:hypothetical protein
MEFNKSRTTLVRYLTFKGCAGHFDLKTGLTSDQSGIALIAPVRRNQKKKPPVGGFFLKLTSAA